MPTDPTAHAIVGVLNARFDELVDRMCRAVEARSAAYASLRDHAGFRESIARTARLYATSLGTGRRLPDSALASLHVVGAERCRQGVPEAEVLDAVRWAAQAGAAFLIRALAEAGPDATAVAEAASTITTSTMDFVSDVQQALSTGWRTEEAHRLPGGARGRATLVDRLVDGGWSESELAELARAEGVDLPPPCLPLLVTAGAWGGVGDLHAVAVELAERLPGALGGVLRAGPVPHAVVVVGNAGDRRLPAVVEAAESAACAHDVLVVVAPPVDHWEDAPAAYRQTATHLAFARVERRWPGLLRSERLRVYDLLSRLTIEERTDLCLSVLGPVLRLKPPKPDELLTAFEALGEAGGSHEQAAVLLGPGVNAHTVRYRLRRLKELTGLRWDIDGERLLLGLAVRTYRAWVAPALHDARNERVRRERAAPV